MMLTSHVDRQALDLMHPTASARRPGAALAVAVIAAAIADARNTQGPEWVRAQARGFLTSSALDFWCAWLDLNPDAVRSRLLRDGR